MYRLYGQFEERSISDILVGYDIQDFVVAHGRICAALLVREFDAKSIRVLLMNTDFQSVFHPSVTLSAESGLSLSYGDKEVKIPPKAEVIIDTADERLKDGRIVAAPLEKGDSISVNSIKRSYGIPAYGGTIEVRKEADGLVLINELYLEDYLTKVVPSEMPDSYEKEALKAQAVCAGPMLTARFRATPTANTELMWMTAPDSRFIITCRPHQRQKRRYVRPMGSFCFTMKNRLKLFISQHPADTPPTAAYGEEIRPYSPIWMAVFFRTAGEC